MKKLISLLITFLFVFNFVSVAFYTQDSFIDFESFDNFSIEQVQNTFSNALTNAQTSNNQNDTDNMFVFNDLDVNVCEIVASQGKISKVLPVVLPMDNNVNYLYKYKLFEQNICFNRTKITEYRMNFNSYIAIVLFDISNFRLLYI